MAYNKVKVNEGVVQRMSKILEDYIGREVKLFCSQDTFLWRASMEAYAGHPIIWATLCAQRHVVIPVPDWEKLMLKKVSPEDYVKNSVWHFGYGENTGRFFWQTLDDGKPGIRNKYKVRRFLKIMECHLWDTKIVKNGWVRNCSNCEQKKCPLNKNEEKREGNTLKKEINQNEVLTTIYEVAEYSIKTKYGLKTRTLSAPELLVFPEVNLSDLDYWGRIFLEAGKPGYVEVAMSFTELLDIMYFPEKYDVEKILGSYPIVAARECYGTKEMELMVTTSETITADLLEFWYKKNV